MLGTKSAPLALACVVLSFATGCELFLGQVLVGSGVVTTEFRETEPFSRLDVGGAIHAEVTIGEPQSIEVTGDDNIVPLVITEVRDGTLVVKTDHRGRMRIKKGIKVAIVTPQLNRLDVSGACHVNVDGLEVGEFVIDVSGASSVAASGNCGQLVADASGASKIDTVALEAESVEVDASGASTAKVTATQTLVADASGASTIRYAGDPVDVKAEKSGASSVKALQSVSQAEPEST